MIYGSQTRHTVIVLFILVEATIPLKIRPRILTFPNDGIEINELLNICLRSSIPVNGHFLSMYDPLIASAGVL